MSEPLESPHDALLYAGFLCATHVGKILRVNGYEGMCHEIRHRDDKATVLVVLYTFTGGYRTDGALKRVVNVVSVDPRAVVEVLRD